MLLGINKQSELKVRLHTRQLSRNDQTHQGQTRKRAGIVGWCEKQCQTSRARLVLCSEKFLLLCYVAL